MTEQRLSSLQLIWCTSSFALISAPNLTSSLQKSSCPCSTARCRRVRSGVFKSAPILLVAAAPFLRRNEQISRFPFCAAILSGVLPCLYSSRHNQRDKMYRKEFDGVEITGIRLTSSFASIFAPKVNNTLQRPNCPRSTARCRRCYDIYYPI
jgi:hypothetical protein